MTRGALRVSAIALSAAAFVLSSPLPAANAATVAHHYGHAAHPRVSHGLHGHVARLRRHRYVAHGHAGHRHYVWRNGHRYAYGYGYNPGAGVAAGVIAGAAAGYPYCGDYYYGSYYGSCDDYSYGYPYPYYDYGYGFGGPVFVGGGRFHHRFATASTAASLSTGAGATSPGEISATRAASAAASSAALPAATRAALAAVTSSGAISAIWGGFGGGHFGGGGHFSR